MIPRLSVTLTAPRSAPLRLSFDQPTIVLGRSDDCTIPIRDRFLSRQHAEICWDGEGWRLRDCASANGTRINGKRLTESVRIQPGDRIGLGETELVIEKEASDFRVLPIDSSPEKSYAIPLQKAVDDDASHAAPERARLLNELALQFIEDRPMEELFDFILDRVQHLLLPSRTAIALFAEASQEFSQVRARRTEIDSGADDLTISRTLLREVIDERKVISYVDTGLDDAKLSRALSIVSQQIRAAVCAPLIADEKVLGVLYLDFTARQRTLREADIRLIAQIARFAAAKLENTRLREQAAAQARIEEELRTAYKIQSRLLPATLPQTVGYQFAGMNRPCRTVSGDYYDVLVRPDGRIYFAIADVSGKGIGAALIMAALATAFNIFARTDPEPSAMLRELNETLTPRTAPTKFATMFFGLLDPASGVVRYANAGHEPPLLVGRDRATPLDVTDMVLGLVPGQHYRDQQIELSPGDSLFMFTDGITEAEDASEAQLGREPLLAMMNTLHGSTAEQLMERVGRRLKEHTGEHALIDDLTMLAISRD